MEHLSQSPWPAVLEIGERLATFGYFAAGAERHWQTLRALFD